MRVKAQRIPGGLMRIMWFIAMSVTLVMGSTKEKRSMEPELVVLVEKVDAKTATIQTIKARFTQRKEIRLLKEPVLMGGNFYFKRQHGFKFEFNPEDDLLIVITNEATIALSHGSKQASRIKMKKRHGRLVERLLSDKIKSLSTNFSIALAEPTGAGKVQHMILKPYKRRVKKRIESVHIWINSDYLINKIKVIAADGDTFELALLELRLNEEIADSFFEVTIPKNYHIGDRMEFLFSPGATF